MSLKNNILMAVILLFIYIRTLFKRLKLYLGIEKCKYGIIGYYEYNGMPLPDLFAKERFHAATKYDAFRPDDVVIVTYSKTGTNFTEDVISTIYKEKGLYEKEFKVQSRMEFDYGKSANEKNLMSHMDNLTSPRIISTHLPWDWLPERVRQGKVKVIHCLRNPKDVACSGFPFFKKVGMIHPNLSWEEYFHYFLDEKVPHGGYFWFLKQWYPNRHNTNLLNLQFEDMKKDLRANVIKIAEFLSIELTNEQVDRVVTANTFENKKKEAGSLHILYRKGKSGGWKSQFTVEQNELMDDKIERELGEMTDLNLQYS